MTNALLMDHWSRDVRSVHRWLSWLPGRDRVRIVTMDMWAPYRDAVQQTLPNALIVVDRWHVQKEIGKALDAVRVRLRNAAKTCTTARRPPL